MDNIFITVAIPCYNGEKTLERCVDSILLQTYTNYELLIIQDGSTDKTPEIAEQLCKKDARIRVIHQENRGLSASRNRAIREARGEYISFIDADDTICPDYIEKLQQAVLMYKADIAVCQYYIDKKQGNDNGIHTISKQDMYKEILIPQRNFAAFAWNRLYKIELIKKCNLSYDEEIYGNEDELFNFQYLEVCGTIAIVEKELYHYIINNGSIMFSQGYNPKRILANKAFEYMLKASDGKEHHTDTQVAAMWYNLILKRRIYLSHAKVEQKQIDIINQMLRLNPKAFLKAPLPVKYKLAYPIWAII